MERFYLYAQPEGRRTRPTTTTTTDIVVAIAAAEIK